MQYMLTHIHIVNIEMSGTRLVDDKKYFFLTIAQIYS